MIIYNVTINIEEAVAPSWLKYMRETHIPDVMSTGCFEKFVLCDLLTRQSDEDGLTYTIQYYCKNMEKYDLYNEKFSPALQQEHNNLYGGKFVAFRSLMKVLS